MIISKLCSVLLSLGISWSSVCGAAPPLHANRPLGTDTPVFGYDVLGLAKYCDVFLEAPPLPAVSVLLEDYGNVAVSFGNPIPCLERYIVKNNTKEHPNFVTDIQFDLRDGTCVRRGACPNGTTDLKDIRTLIRLLETTRQLRENNKNINFWISPILEHDIKSLPELQALFNALKQSCPNCYFINSPTSAGLSSVPGTYFENHGTKSSAFSISGDGASIFDADNILNDGNTFQHRLAGSEFTFAWIPEWNLRNTGMKKFLAIKDRTQRPTVDLFQWNHKILTTSEDPYPVTPRVCKQVRDLDCSKEEINKVAAERYGGGDGTTEDGRGNKSLLIINKIGGQDMTLHSGGDGKVVGCLKYYGGFSSSKTLGRWYRGNCSSGNNWEFYKSLGQEWAFAKDSSGNCIRFNSLRRQCAYR